MAIRWERRLTKHRDRAAFHVDPEVVASGLALIPDASFTLIVGDGPRHDESWFALGDVALMQGMAASQAEADELVRTVVTDREAVLVALLDVFSRCVRRAGLSVRDSGPPSSSRG